MRVLIVDDSKTIRMAVRKMLLELGHQVEEAEDGKIGFDRIVGTGPFDLVLLDWNMPNMTGIELLKALHEKKITHSRVCMMTTENSMDKIQQALSYGACEYIMKPFTKDVLESKLSELLGAA